MATASGSCGWRTTRPGLAVDHRLGGAPAVAGDLGHAAGRGLEEHDAEALLLEAAQRLRQHMANTSAQP